MRSIDDLKIVVSIEARMTSSRLPGKVLMEVDDKPLLQHMIERVQQAKLVDEIVVATTVNETDEPIVALCEKLGVKVFRGSEDDVLKRVLDAHEFVNSDVIVELTGDCPLIDPKVIDEVVDSYVKCDADYVSNVHVRSYPDGFDVQVFAFNVLKEVSLKTTKQEDREHVSLYIYSSGEYTLKGVVASKENTWPDLRITLDNKGDYLLIKELLEESTRVKGHFYLEEVIAYMKKNKHLLELQKDAVYHEIDTQKRADEAHDL